MPTRGNYMETKKKPGPPTGQLVDGSQPVKLDGLADAVKSATKDRISNRTQPAQSSINNQTNFVNKPNYSSRAGKMVKVLYGRDYSHYGLTRNNNVTLLCTYFATNKRDRRFPNRFKPNQNETSSNDFHSDKRKLCTTTPIQNEQIKIQPYEKKPNKINAVLEGLGFVCNNDKNIFTDRASQIHCYNINKQYNTGYGKKTYTSPAKSKIPVLQKPFAKVKS
ncbi:uncharacterized protein LOC126548937 isoform X3 [Aphis gossypii]|uniref:uncharacterized protein LOC126548937 isoform X2 n=1 Tax=Aphis gossypii TaxID=80765 RepID=UPI00215925C6|nr:uncharacterized protein LOC126548937 isoform X2 [Aphis gossypii]XP_050053011.1 uncharacterized protein LOC126548937 isoform X3 [Aphis gossypii]